MNQFKINVAESPQMSTIELNGQPLKGARRVSLELDSQKRDLSFIKLEIYGEAEVDGQYVEQLIAASAKG